MSRALEVMKIFLLFYMCHFAMGLTYCYKTTFYRTVYTATPHTFTMSEIPWQLVALTLKTLKKSKSGNVLNVKKIITYLFQVCPHIQLKVVAATVAWM